MDLDYHYGTIYVLSRWAKFCSANANMIATSSQFVDDNYDTNPFSDAEEEENIAQGVHVRYSCQNMWGNVTGKGNCEVWIPFHFLPGLVGESSDEKLVCKKNGALAKKLAARLLETTLDNSDFSFRLGIGLHVYADTWAHQEFAGINATLNRVQSLIFARQGSRLEKAIGELIGSDSILSKLVEMMNPLGHAAAVHCPDMPFLWWKSGEHFREGRKNWDEFMEASAEIFKLLQSVSCEPVTGLSERQQNLLMACFKGIQSEDINTRYEEWLQRIHRNYFEFDDFNGEDATAAYSSGTILNDLNFRRQFYNELNDHFDWVRQELLAAGLDVLKSEPIY
ncbi:MAG: hypothetical protein IJ849_02170 [Selenomonadaceae bacterium]|nr:hypothetical protein [Selenomonadaceae bacterium]